jgi:hypothetical protein
MQHDNGKWTYNSYDYEDDGQFPIAEGIHLFH